MFPDPIRVKMRGGNFLNGERTVQENDLPDDDPVRLDLLGIRPLFPGSDRSLSAWRRLFRDRFYSVSGLQPVPMTRHVSENIHENRR
jgi:hypothetical protein